MYVETTSNEYIIDGKRYDRVTSIINIGRKEKIEEWRGRLGNEEADRQLSVSQDLGTRIHAACEDILEQIDAEVTPVIKGEYCEIELLMLQNFMQWALNNVVEIIKLECLLFSDKYRYAGRTDFIARLKGVSLPVICDIKTSKYLYDTVALQLEAYKRAAIEQKILDDALRMGIHISKIDGKITPKYFNGTQDFNAFLGLKAYYDWEKSGKYL